ncbi:MAG TPA: trypsin-like peptidase domain-containing protein [Nannocystaceae bacterium]|nr:trypsin-like peptidase domain-containing protein [Nannocystaceae bacterium]
MQTPALPPIPEPDRAAPGWLAAGAGLAGVLLGAAAVMLGLGRREPTPEAQADAPLVIPAPPVAASPSLPDAVAATIGTVVSLRTPSRAGAGVIVDPEGWIVTNMHVVADVVDRRGAEAPIVRARFLDGRELGAVVVVADRDEDLAVLLLQPEGKEEFTAAQLGASRDLRVGQSVFAIGNPFGLSHTVSSGIVSALDRPAVSSGGVPLIQLDASINVGNSGGPLFTTDGRLVGLVTARDRDAQGIAYALPVDHVHGFLRAITQEGGRRAGALGVLLERADLELPAPVRALGYAAGLPISEVTEGGAAANAGLKPGDVIVEVRGARVDAMVEATDPGRLRAWFVETVRAMFPGERIAIAVVRGDAVERFDVEAGAATDREQTFIDAERVLGVRLDRKATAPTIQSAAGSRGLGRYGAAVEGAVVLELLGRRVADIDALGKVLAELRTMRGTGEELTVWVTFRDASGREGSWAIVVE